MLLWMFTFATATDRDKFEAVYAKYKNLMYHKAYQILHDPMLAEDAVSEAMLRVYKNLGKIDDPQAGRCAAFVVTIVKNAALTLLQKQKQIQADEFTEDVADSFVLEAHVLSELSSERIYELIGGLGEELRGAFLLKYAYDLPHKEIGKILSISENNVTVRLHRAKKKLSQMLTTEGYEA